MSQEKLIALDLAAFLDSAPAAALEGVTVEEVRKVAKIFLHACYEDVGKKPKLLDGHDVHAIVGHILPGHLKKKDPVAEKVPGILDAFVDHLEQSEVVPQIFEIRQSLDQTTTEFLETVRTGTNPHHGHRMPEKPFVHGAEKLGRNDPCSCGSGKKYKKCHGKNA